jgi:lysine/ornithine N-monooxygenase
MSFHQEQRESLKKGDLFLICRSLIRNFNQADRNQFFTPSQSLFSDFCQSLVDKYELDELLEEGTVVDIIPLTIDNIPAFKVVYTRNETVHTILSKKVVLALGNAYPVIPDWVPTNRNECGVNHALDLMKDSSLIKQKDNLDKLLVIGGGLTGAQLVHKAITMGYKKVFLNSP